MRDITPRGKTQNTTWDSLGHILCITALNIMRNTVQTTDILSIFYFRDYLLRSLDEWRESQDIQVSNDVPREMRTAQAAGRGASALWLMGV